MEFKSSFLHTLLSERKLTRATIAAVAGGDLTFTPSQGQMSFGGQALHILLAQETLLEAFTEGTWNWNRGLDLERFPTLEAILARFDAMHAAELSFYEGLDNEAFDRPVNTSWGSPEPLSQLALSFLTHETHHRGQLVVYLRLMGIQPPNY